MGRYKLSQYLLVLNLYIVLKDKFLVAKLITAKVSHKVSWCKLRIFKSNRIFETKHNKINRLKKTKEYKANELITKYAYTNIIRQAKKLEFFASACLYYVTIKLY